ncbi:alpha/beta fold hydrolase [Albimonas pacifica]|uniref:Pimeloyl-ACP methyl ester carboxylesterase n=1 Tax=Albimonas pacifica TaxID=1114924 RepID=A0A1I3FUH2_9RHOB|nr:alpha/beta hydrolase [Albimonas pacifica]SFI14893.1 Pimeloyl-ACP methyl ester carboxylesterase [Albimonas pacifica]
MMPMRSTIAAAVLSLAFAMPTPAAEPENPYQGIDVSDETLVSELAGFERGFAEVNGVRLHYVEGGEGTPIILMPGWPQTWWAFHKIMPALAQKHHVVAVDIRGMGASEKPEGGYDKKTMARDIQELIHALGYEKAHIVGHDIGSHVAYAFAANHPEAAWSTTYLDVAGLPASIKDLKLLPEPGSSGDFADTFFLWWFAFHQVNGMPEKLIEGRAHIYQEWFWDNLLYDSDAITTRDRAVYANAYNSAGGIRGGNGWYKAYPQDLVDNAAYPERIEGPTLGIGGLGHVILADFMEKRHVDPELVHLQESGHYVAEEAPDEVTRLILGFIDGVENR